MRDPDTLPGFAGVHLPESIVRTVAATPGSLVVSLDAYLRRTHPRWREPRPGEAWTWAPATIEFDGVSALRWRGGHRPVSRSADGTTDHGDLDVFTADGDAFHLESGAGDIDVVATAVRLTFDPDLENP